MSLPLPDTSAALEAFTGQPDLLALMDVNQPVVSEARVFLHTGKTTTANAQHAARIIAAASIGWSVRKIARELKHSRNTVAAVLRLAEEAGKVEPVQKRVLAAAAEAIHADIELGNELRSEEATPQEISALATLRRSTWVGAGILADKGAAAPAPSVTVINQGDGVVNVVAAYAERMKQLGADSASVGRPPVSSVSSDQPVIDVDGDAGGPVPALDTVHGQAGQDPAGQGEGGGIGPAGGLGNSDE